MAIRGGKPIAFGVNKRRHTKDGSVFFCSTHAEIDLMKKLGDKIKDCKIFVYRFNNTNHATAREPKCGKPCPLCQHVLKKAGAKKVFYMNMDGEVEMMKNQDMISLIGSPCNITKYFLLRNGDESHGKFHAMNYVESI